MSARDEVLGRVRAALAQADTSQVPLPASVIEQRSAAPAHSPAMIDLFVERVEDYRATVHRCTPDEVEGVLAELLGERSTVVPAGFGWSVPNPREDTGLSAAELDQVDAVVTTAALGIAVTGTIVLTHGPGQGRRALSLVPDLHVCVVREDQVVPGVPQTMPLLDPTSPQTWISGPSATSDIELNRVEGVHGPRTLRVLLLGS